MLKTLIILLTVLLMGSCDMPFEKSDESQTIIFGESKTKAVYGSMKVTGGIVGEFNFDYGEGSIGNNNIFLLLHEKNDNHEMQCSLQAPIDTIGIITKEAAAELHEAFTIDIMIYNASGTGANCGTYAYGAKAELTITAIDSLITGHFTADNLYAQRMKRTVNNKNETTYVSDKELKNTAAECTFRVPIRR